MPALWGSGPARTLALVLWSCVPSFCPLCCSSLGALSTNMALFRILRAFLAWFMGFAWVCVVLVLCVACGALYACGVRRIRGLLRVCLSFCPFAYLLLPFVLSLCSCFLSCLSSLCSALLWLFFVVVFLDLCLCFLFPLRTIRKERAQRFCPCVLSLCVVGCSCFLSPFGYYPSTTILPPSTLYSIPATL